MSSPIYNPPVPYSGHIVGGFHPGRMVRIQGRATSSASSIIINLQTGPNASYDDIALHFNPRFNESCIVRNSRTGSGWGSEARQGPPLPIYRDQNFEILIMSEASMYKIAVNGQHFTEFTHRIPVEHVSFLSVEGDLTISLIQFDGGSSVTQSSAYQASAPPMGFGAAAVGGGLPYPTSGGALPSTGFSIPPPMGGGAPYPGGGGGVPYPAGGSPYPAGGGGGNPYPSSPQGGGYPPPNSAPVYGGYNPGGGPPPQQYPPPTSGPGYYPPQQPGGYPGQQPQGYYPPPQGYDPHAPHSGSSGGGGGMLGGASKLLAGGLAGVGLAKVANKIPGLGGGGHGGHGGGHYGGGGYAPGGHGGGGGGGLTGMVGKVLGPAAALGVGGMAANKATKGHKKNKLLKYGLPVGGALVGGYALKKGMKGFGHHGHGSSSSSSSSEEE